MRVARWRFLCWQLAAGERVGQRKFSCSQPGRRGVDHSGVSKACSVRHSHYQAVSLEQLVGLAREVPRGEVPYRNNHSLRCGSISKLELVGTCWRASLVASRPRVGSGRFRAIQLEWRQEYRALALWEGTPISTINRQPLTASRNSKNFPDGARKCIGSFRLSRDT